MRPKARMRFGATSLCAVVVMAVAVGCGFEGESGEPDLSVSPGFGIDSGWAVDTEDGYVMTKLGITEPLTKVGFDGETRPSLARSWERVDERNWRFELREGAEFHNGEPADAEAVSESLKGVLGLSTPPPGLEPDSLQIEPAGESAVEITTSEPDPILPERLTSPNVAILAPEAYESEGPPEPFGMGTGPFELPEEPSGESVTLEAFEGYWGGEPEAGTVEARFIEDPQTRVQSLRAGDIDLAEEVPIPQLDDLREEQDTEVVQEEVSRTVSLYTNMRSGPLEDKQVREAVRLAVDNETLAGSVMEGSATPASSIFSPAEPWSEEAAPEEHDPERARQLLQEAGYEPGELTLSLSTYTGRSELPALAQAVQSQLSEAGIETEVQVSEYSALEPQVLEGDYDLFILTRSYLNDGNDPSGFLSDDYSCEGSYNINGYCSEEFDALLEELEGASEQQSRYELFRRAEGMIREDVAGVPLLYYQLRTAHDDGVSGYQTHPQEHYLLTPEIDGGG
ncbi:MAG: ABC transporter substrate-binding protein [Rubrobacter sp.]|nr:ABC transporter substrate-binding protein [Rubrobacter sp.]